MLSAWHRDALGRGAKPTTEDVEMAERGSCFVQQREGERRSKCSGLFSRYGLRAGGKTKAQSQQDFFYIMSGSGVVAHLVHASSCLEFGKANPGSVCPPKRFALLLGVDWR